MDVMYPRSAGLDVHQEFVVVCRRVLEREGGVTKETRRYSTMTRDLLQMSDWLADAAVTHVVMESSGVLWKPIWNLLEDRFTILLVNAHHVKQVPGRKTDVSDAEWLAQLLQHGLLRGSFVPPPPLRDLRDLTRHRTTLVQERTRVVNRIHKVLEDANIKLSAVASDVLGVSGRAMLQALIAGETDAVHLADLAQRRLRRKRPALIEALTGRVRPHHRFLLQTLLTHVDFLATQLGELDARIDAQLRPFAAELALIRTIPGLKHRTGECVLAEVGPTMTPFASANHLCSWAAVCPGLHETAGKRRSGQTRRGNRWLRGALTEAAWAAARTKGTYTAGQYRRLAARRGKKRALVAVSHHLLRAVYHVLHDGVPYKDLGAQHFDRLAPDQLTRYLVKRLERLGHKVTLETGDVAA
jgi:transposase